MKNWLLFFALTITLMSVSCSKKENTLFEDGGEKIDQGIHNAGEKIDQGLDKAGENLDKAGEKVRDATH